MYIEDIKWCRLFKSGGGKGSSAKPLTVSENGTYTAPAGKGYTPVYVDVGGSGIWSDVVGLAIVGRSIVGYEGGSALVEEALVGSAIVGDGDGNDVVGVAIAGRSIIG